jgi:uncharacterized membrane protein
MSMNKRKWIAAEAQKWKEAGIISDGQLEQIINRYPEEPRLSALPIFAAILLGLGVLTFIASNWQGLAALTKLAIIVVSLVAAYASGDYFQRKGHERLGIALSLVGIAIYGAGFFLIGQIYQLSSNPVYAFYLWFAGAIPLAWYYRSRVLTWACLLILFVSAFYGVDSNHRDGPEIFLFYLLFAAGMIPLLWKFRSTWLTAVSGILFVIYAIYDLRVWGEGMVIPVLFLLLYLTGQRLPASSRPIPQVLQILSYVGTLFFTIYLIFDNAFARTQTGFDTAMAACLGILSGLSVFHAHRTRRRALMTDAIPYATFILFYMLAPVVWLDRAVLLIVGMFAFSIAMVLGGERMRDVGRINLGAVFFGISCFVGYINFAWDFMDKSLFFLVGGALMLMISILLERKRRKWVDEARRGSR